MADVFVPQANDTPVLTPGWTVQSTPAGEESLVSHAGPTGLLAAQVAHQTATGEASFTGTTADATAAKLSDLQAVAAKLDALNAAMVSAGVEAAS